MKMDQIQEQFEIFNAKNPHILESLKIKALWLKRIGHTWYSIDMLVHSLRVDRDMETFSSDGYKINDHFTSRYARLLMSLESELVGFFKTKPLRSSLKAN